MKPRATRGGATKASAKRATAKGRTQARKTGWRSRRTDILERAADLIGQKGFAGMSARNLAEALEFSKANFFYHVRSKEQLLYELFIENLNYAIRHIEEIVQRPDPAPDRLRAIIDFYVTLNTERASIMLVWFKEKTHLTEPHQAHISALEQQIGAMLNGFYNSGIKSGDFRRVEPRLARVAIFGMCFALTRWPDLQEEFSIETISTQLQEVACGGMLKPPERR
jgi:TetR/AcrR family transcriptional regulator, cholesterol catabolism regulator